MRLKILFVLLTNLLLTNANAQLLWKINKEGSSKVSYIFGTHHLIDTSHVRNFSHVLKLVENADLVVGEIDLETPNMQDTIMKYAMLEGESLRDYLDKDEYDVLDGDFKRLVGLGLQEFDNYKPMFISALYTNVLYFRQFWRMPEDKAIDIIIQARARANGVKVVGLETVSDQASMLFASVPIRRQKELLIDEVAMQKENMKNSSIINVAYVNGDIAKIEELDRNDKISTDEEKLMINDYRNERWISRITDLLNKEYSCFIAVGFLHFTGNKSILMLLRENGYTVTPVAFQQEK